MLLSETPESFNEAVTAISNDKGMVADESCRIYGEGRYRGLSILFA